MADGGWEAGTWEGNRREQLRKTLELSVRERLQALEDLSETSERLSQVGDRGGPSARAVGESGREEADPRDTGAEAAHVREAPEHYGAEGPRTRVEFGGCRPVPLAAYLKALGVLRLIAEQADPDARGAWSGDTFVLESRLDRDDIRDFFLHRYEPTPILAPWNGGSGFYPEKDNTEGIDAITGGSAARLAPLRETIEAMCACLADLGLTEKPSNDAQKELLLKTLRSKLPERALTWMDAAVALTDDGPKYPPLLGTGGNDGRLEFANNFMQRVVDVIDAASGEPSADAPALLDDALFAAPVPALASNAIGQFAPGSAGGPNASTGFSGNARINPWDFVLMLEGAVLFAAAATRRLESTGRGQLSYPFTVRPTGAGSGGAALSDEANARAETWVPLWNQPARLSELRALLGEGRVVVGRRVARDGLDFVRAIAQLGVARGVSQFQRYSFMMRSGRTYLATPLNRVVVRRNPTADLIDQLHRGRWLDRFRGLARRTDAPARLKSCGRRLDGAIFALASGRSGDSQTVQDVLIALGQAQRYLATSPSVRERCPPVPLLGAKWVREASDPTAEFHLAVALAGIHARRPRQGRRDDEVLLPFGAHLAPIGAEHRGRWTDDHHRVVWGHASLARNITAVFERRFLEADRLDLPDLPLAGWTGAPLAAVSAWMSGGVDAERISALLPGLALARTPRLPDTSESAEAPVPAAFGVLKPLFTTRAQLQSLGVIGSAGTGSFQLRLLRLLAADELDSAIALAVRRLRADRLAPVARPSSIGVDASLLTPALMVPLSDYALRRTIRRTLRRLDADDDDRETLTSTKES